MERKIKQTRRYRRHRRTRAKIFGTAKVPRLCVFRSNKHIYAQLIDDEKRKTLIAVADKGLKIKAKKLKAETKGKTQKPFESKLAEAYEVGKLIAGLSLKKGIEKIIFDRGGYKYHGRIKALAEGARKGGLRF